MILLALGQQRLQCGNTDGAAKIASVLKFDPGIPGI